MNFDIVYSFLELVLKSISTTLNALWQRRSNLLGTNVQDQQNFVDHYLHHFAFVSKYHALPE